MDNCLQVASIINLSVCLNILTGSALVKCGQTQQKLGQAERDFISSAANGFIQPLKAFLDGDMKTVQVEAFHLY